MKHGGVIIERFNRHVCHNLNCKQALFKPKKENAVVVVCSQCQYTEYCSEQCRKDHWIKRHMQECKALANINFIESLQISSRCPQIPYYGLHKHPKIINDKITHTKSQIEQQVLHLANENTVLSCQCNRKIGNSNLITSTVLLENVPCMNINIVHVFVRCKKLTCNQRKKGEPLFSLCPLSPAQKTLIVIPNQKQMPSALEFINNDSKNIGSPPEDFSEIVVEPKLIKNCAMCIKSHVDFKVMARRTKGDDNENNDNDNTSYIYNDTKDTWELTNSQ